MSGKRTSEERLQARAAMVYSMVGLFHVMTTRERDDYLRRCRRVALSIQKACSGYGDADKLPEPLIFGVQYIDVIGLSLDRVFWVRDFSV